MQRFDEERVKSIPSFMKPPGRQMYVVWFWAALPQAKNTPKSQSFPLSHTTNLGFTMPRKCLNLKIGHVVPPFLGNHDKRYTLDVPVRCIYSTSSAFAALDAAGDVRCWGDCSSGGELDEQPQEVTHIFGNEAGQPGQVAERNAIGPKGQSQSEFFFWGGVGARRNWISFSIFSQYGSFIDFNCGWFSDTSRVNF